MSTDMFPQGFIDYVLDDLRKPEDWSIELGIEILDPDGWRCDDGRSWDEPISEEEFYERAAQSTIRFAKRYFE